MFLWNTPKKLFVLLLAGAVFLSSTAATADTDDDDDDWNDDQEEETSKLELHGFGESVTGSRVVKDGTTADHFVAGEARFRIEVGYDGDIGSLSFKGDLIGDAVDETLQIDIREVAIKARVFSWLDLQAGRLVLTWGTGDLLFLNDLFPKDFVSFFSGRADEYLKAPTNAIKLSFYSRIVNIDLVWMPIFISDRYITGERLSFFNPMMGNIVGGQKLVDPIEPSLRFDNGELAARIYRRLGSLELALYGYAGYSKQPSAYDPVAKAPTFYRLNVYGLSIRGAMLGGIANLESAFYHSVKDKSGRKPTIPNHQLRGLAGYERELVSKLTLGLQYYIELTLFHDRLLASSQTPQFEPDEVRHVVTARLLYLMLQDNLSLSLFAFYSPSDEDFYLRPSITYKLSDALQLAVGGNVMWGNKDHTFFGQLRKNSNLYGRVRYTF